MLKRLFLAGFLLFSAHHAAVSAESALSVVVSVPEQKLLVLKNGLRLASYAISTSKFGLGDRSGSYATPLGEMEVADKVGAGAPLGAVFKGCRRTGEVLRANAPGRDPIVTRILRLRGLESKNCRALNRGIFIHGTPQERLIGRPASYGCIRMRSRDVVELYNSIGIGTKVEILNISVSRALREVAIN